MPQTPVSTPAVELLLQAPLDPLDPLDPPGMARLVIRPFDSGHDSRPLITRLLHRAAASLDTTANLPGYWEARARVMHRSTVNGACFVAVCKRRIVGTLTLRGPDPASVCRHFRRPDVAWIHRYGVEPLWQRRGIGRALLSFGNRWAAAHGYMQLALDAPMNAHRLLDFYAAQGFRLVDTVRFPGSGCESAVLSRPSLPGWPCTPASRVGYRSR